MARYHVNPTTGNAGVCTAKDGNCPLGSVEANPHFSSQEEARSHAEEVLNKKYEWRAMRTVSDEKGNMLTKGGPVGEQRTLSEAKELLQELKENDAKHPPPAYGEPTYELVRKPREWESVSESFNDDQEDPNQLELIPRYVVEQGPERRIAENLTWGDYEALKAADPSLARPDVDYGFNWAPPPGASGTSRVSLAKWHDDETGTLYVYHEDGSAAVIAHNVTQEEVDRHWHEVLEERTMVGGVAQTSAPSVERLIAKLRRNNG